MTMRKPAGLLLALLAVACGDGDAPSEAESERGPVAVGALTDPQIAQLVGLINGVEAAVGRAVDSKLTLPATQAYARMLVTDHTRLMQAMPGLPSPRIPPPQAHGLNAVFHSQAAMMATLPSGNPFDATFIATQVGDHAMAIDSLMRWHQDARDPELRQAIAAALPVMQSHLEQAKALYSGLDRGIDLAFEGPDTLAPDTLPVDPIPPPSGPDPDTLEPDTTVP